jgi:hypothetical protein
MAELHDSPDHKAFRATFTKSAQEPIYRALHAKLKFLWVTRPLQNMR